MLLKYIEAAKYLDTKPKWDGNGDGTFMRQRNRCECVQMKLTTEVFDGTSPIVDIDKAEAEINRGGEIELLE